MKSCKAIVSHGVIQFLIDQDDDAYGEFSEVLSAIEERGFFSYYGDVTDVDGSERCGLKITASATALPKPTHQQAPRLN